MTSENSSSAPQPVPATSDAALELVRSRFGQPTLPDGTPVRMHVREFDIGYVVYAVYPEPPRIGGIPQPAPPGGSNFVVSKATGEIATVPNYPPEQAIEVFRRHYSG